MGPYMRPIPIGASAAMLFSLLVAFIVTPWAAVRILKPGGVHHAGEREDFVTRLYRRVHGRVFCTGRLCGGASSAAWWSCCWPPCSLFYIGFVKVKMLPFDNKSEFQVIVDMPNGTTLEETARVTQLLAEETQKQREVVNVQTYVGTASPYNFNGLVRHYYLRRGPNVADIQVNLLPKDARNLQSHEIAKQVRQRLLPIAERYGARIKVAEVPPGPPVLETLVAEVYGPTHGAADRAGAADARSVQADQGRRGRRLVRGRRSNEVPLVWSTRRRPRSTAFPRTTSRAPCRWPPPAIQPDCCIKTRKRKMSR